MGAAEIIFIIIALFTMIGALMTVLSGSLIYAMMGLISTLFGVAGLYIYLNAPFLAMMQILIYVGAVSILIAFAIMLAGPFTMKPKEWTTVTKFIGSIVVSVVSFVLVFRAIMQTPWVQGKIKNFNVTTKDLGRIFLDRLAFPFEIISLLIVIAIIGAIMLALFSRRQG
ncbi:MAG: NADH-quinone oxidoreductase subunit J [Syntrophorhabdaceae bacterium]|nr:NADH-quinone oxidoreductase subunit J [Syntrophorhabdaceae bacterium]